MVIDKRMVFWVFVMLGILLMLGGLYIVMHGYAFVPPLTGFQSKCQPGVPGGPGGCCGNGLCEQNEAYECPNDCPPAEPSSGSSEPTPTQQELFTSLRYVGQSSSSLAFVRDIIAPVLSIPPETLTEPSSTVSPTSAGPLPVGVCATGTTAILCANELQRIRPLIDAAFNAASAQHGALQILYDKYPSSSDIERDYELLTLTLQQISAIRAAVTMKLSVTTTELVLQTQRRAQEQLAFAASVESHQRIFESYYTSYTRVIPSVTEASCGAPIQGILFSDAVGGSFVDTRGQSCVPPVPPPRLTPLPGVGSSAPTGGADPSYGSGPIFTFTTKPEEGKGLPEAVVLGYDQHGVPRIGILLAPTHGALEEKIAAFTNRLFFGEAANEPLPDISLESVGKNTEEQFWLGGLWVVVGALLISFLLFNRLLIADHERLLTEGRQALTRKDYRRALSIYHGLVSCYPELAREHGFNIKQKILSYFIVLKKSLTSSHIKFNVTTEDNKFPIITLSQHFLSVNGGDAHRVEQMIRDALHELHRAPKVARSRMPAIAEAYKYLDNKERAKLALLYERLVYGLRDAKK